MSAKSVYLVVIYKLHVSVVSDRHPAFINSKIRLRSLLDSAHKEKNGIV